MRTWTKSACIVLAWSILLVSLMAAGVQGSVHPAQASTRTGRNTEVSLTSTLSVAAVSVTATSSPTNRQAIGPDPNAIHPGTVLTLPRPAAPSPPTPGAGHPYPVPPSSPPAVTRHHPRPVTQGVPATGLPQWLKIMLLALGLFILVAFLAEPVRRIHRRRQHAAIIQAVQRRRAETGPTAASQRPCSEEGRIVLADYDRLVVTRDEHDGTAYVLRPPGEDPKAILRVARLVLPEGQYGELARQLRVPASWPMN